MLEKIKIGNVEIEKTACLAPMASVADRAYRDMCKSYSASYVVSEMISAKGLCYSDRKTEELCLVTEKERPMALQLFGEDPEFIKKAVLLIKKYNPDIIDINMGCPVPKIAGSGSGSALMKTPLIASEIVKAAVEVSPCPVTVKFRSGWDDNNINAVEFAKIMEESGAAALTVHPRTRVQMYNGKANWSIIKDVKEAVSIPVIGSGDVVDLNSCIKMYEETGCDLVMIGRGTYGKPWIFQNIYEHFAGLPLTKEPDLEERFDIMLSHARKIVEYKGEHIGIREARKHLAWYLKGMKNAAAYRNSCASLNTMEDIENLVVKIKLEEN